MTLVLMDPINLIQCSSFDSFIYLSIYTVKSTGKVSETVWIWKKVVFIFEQTTSQFN